MQPVLDQAIASVDAPLATATVDGRLRAATPRALALLCLPPGATHTVPAELWARLEAVPVGSAVQWHRVCADRENPIVVGCSRYAAAEGYLIILKEVSDKENARSDLLRRERLAAIGRLVASIAHELRNTVASITYSTDLLAIEELPVQSRAEVLEEISHAARRLQGTVDGLLDFARLGPSVSVLVSLQDTLTRAQGALRSAFRGDGHRLSIEIAKDADSVFGNSLVIENVFVNLLVNAAQSASRPDVSVRIRAERSPSRIDGRAFVRVHVMDDGPGVPERDREAIFAPFFTTRPDGTGLGLTNALESVQGLGGTLTLVDSEVGAHFVIDLPAPPAAQSSAELGVSS